MESLDMRVLGSVSFLLGDEEIIRETFARVFDSGTRVVLEAVSHSGGGARDVA
jgi:hypothetical protein